MQIHNKSKQMKTNIRAVHKHFGLMAIIYFDGKTTVLLYRLIYIYIQLLKMVAEPDTLPTRYYGNKKVILNYP